MRLNNLTLHYFKGLKEFTFNPDGKSVDIFGANETGKTTIADALTWLLFDKDTLGSATGNFGIKTRENGEVVHGVDHEVEGVFGIGSGKTLTIKKVYKENWVKRRGNAEQELSGHTTDYYLDDIPVKKGEYQSEVNKVMDEKLFRILTIPQYFPEQLDWKERRAILFDLVGDISTEDIIASHPKLSEYPKILSGRTHEQQEKLLKSKKKEMNEQIERIPNRIDENERMKAQVTGVAEAEIKIEALKEQREALTDTLADIKNGGGISQLRIKVEELEAKKAKLRTEHQQQIEESLFGKRAKVTDLQDKVDEIESEFREAKREYEEALSNQSQLESIVASAEKLLKETEDRQPEPDNDPDECPYCHRPMEKEHSYGDYLKEFNTKKAEDIKEAKVQVDAAQRELGKAIQLREEKGKIATNINGRLTQRQEALKKAQKELERKKLSQEPVMRTDAWKEIEEQQRSLQSKIGEFQNNRSEQIDKMNEKIKGIEQKITEQQAIISAHEQNKRIDRRIDELQGQWKTASKELEEVERQLFVMEEFVRARSKFVTAKVNKRFSLVEWKLFENQMNGGVKEICEANYKGVPYSSGLNNAGRVQVGLDIINTLSDFYSKEAPVLIDNREGVTKLPETDLQVISLIVSPEHEKISVKVDPKPKFQLA
ncbi:MAG TPA: hypothetical protein VJ964_04580 [Balneolaceae bacterium]|nr:hypothetical protein [Balneolaceae bacterium]